MTNSPYNTVSDERLRQLQLWLARQGYRADTLTPMSVDAGFRRYFRLPVEEGSLIAVDAPPQHEDTESFVAIANKLHNSGLITPVVHCYNLEKGYMLLSDLGSLHLQDAATPADTTTAAPLYKQAVLNLLKIQINTSTDGLAAYSADFLRQEIQLFPEWYLQAHLQHRLSPATRQHISRCFDLCIESAMEQPVVFVHRDYHCRNLMVQADQEIAVIDFQGALRGPITYDLVSLLRDAYVEWPETFLNPLLEMHRSSVATLLPGNNITAETYQKWFDLMGLQRHLKILGIFCRLQHRDGKSHYLDSIPLVRKYIETVCLKYSEFSVLYDLLAEVRPRELQKGRVKPIEDCP